MEINNPAIREVHEYFVSNLFMAITVKEAVLDMNEKGTKLSRFTILDAITELEKQGYLKAHNMSTSLTRYQYEKPLPKREFKRKFNFHAGSNI